MNYLDLFSKIDQEYLNFRLKNPLFLFKKKDLKKKTYVIDVPPRYASGKLHLGHAISYTLQDIVARIKVKEGFLVGYPLCFDVNGLPIELHIEKEKKINPHINLTKFLEECILFSEKNIEEMKKEFIALHIFFDKSLSYQTNDPFFREVTKKNFITLFKKKRIEHSFSAVNWCSSCLTVLSEAELEKRKIKEQYLKIYLSKDSFVYFNTDSDIKKVFAIANPTNETTFFDVPLLKFSSPNLLTNQLITPHDGKKEYLFYKKKGTHKIDLSALTKDIHISFEHTKIEKEEINNIQNVCWRCKNKTFVLEKKQWVLKVLDLKKKIKELANSVIWTPIKKQKQLLNWIDEMSFDWVLSRQRYFSTKIPLVKCTMCDTYRDEFSRKCICGNTKYTVEKEVLDTWMDSSLTYNFLQKQTNSKINLRFQSEDIIRTWAGYTLFKSFLEDEQKPWDRLLLSPYVVDFNNKPMHTSDGNAISFKEIISKYGLNSLRFFACTLPFGETTPLSKEKLLEGQSFQIKIYNCFLFCLKKKFNSSFSFLDLWMHQKIQKCISIVKKNIDDFKLSEYIFELKEFFFNFFCSIYLEKNKQKETISNIFITIFLIFLNYVSPVFPSLSWYLSNLITSEREDIDKKQFSGTNTVFFSDDLFLEIEHFLLLCKQKEINKLKAIELNPDSWPNLFTDENKKNFEKTMSIQLIQNKKLNKIRYLSIHLKKIEDLEFIKIYAKNKKEIESNIAKKIFIFKDGSKTYEYNNYFDISWKLLPHRTENEIIYVLQ